VIESESAGRIGGPGAVARPALAYLVPIAGALVALAAGVETGTVLVAVAASAIVCAAVRALVEIARIATARDRADRWIGMRVGQPPPDELLLARIDELLHPRLRPAMARSFRRIAADAAGSGRMVSPAQCNRRALRPHVPQIAAVAERLADGSRPVSPRGMALVHLLITSGGSPLYNARSAGELPARLGAALAALDVDQVGVVEPRDLEAVA
jgi:hypothetical protein